jgi:hypothetical protein
VRMELSTLAERESRRGQKKAGLERARLKVLAT